MPFSLRFVMTRLDKKPGKTENTKGNSDLCPFDFPENRRDREENREKVPMK